MPPQGLSTRPQKSGLARNDRDLGYKNAGEGARATKENLAAHVSVPRLRLHGHHYHRVRRYAGRELSGELAEVLMLPEIVNTGAEVRGISELRPAYADRLSLAPRLKSTTARLPSTSGRAQISRSPCFQTRRPWRPSGS